MATISIFEPLNHGDAMPDPVTGTLGLAFAKQAPTEATDDGGASALQPPGGPGGPGLGGVTVTFVRTDASAPDLNVTAVVSGNKWSAPSTTVPNGTYSVVATAIVGTDPPATDGRDEIHKP